MYGNMDRRSFIRFFGALAAVGCFRPAMAAEFAVGHSATSNFKAVYNTPALRTSFLSFLKNVYSIYPPDKFHALIAELVAKNQSDEAIYKALQIRLPDVKSMLAPITRQLPALGKQKDEMAQQVAKLMKGNGPVDGYMEIGTTGRYVHGVEKTAKVKGSVYLLHTMRPQFFSLIDIAERGQLFRPGKYVNMGDYKDIADSDVPRASLGLVTNFIGFHHAPPEQRDAFITSVASKLKTGGKLILRDHDVDSENMRYIAALAHDVFNAGLEEKWAVNAAEVRNFTSADQIEEALLKAGLARTGEKLQQAGDPTQNTLMMFTRT